MNAKIDSWNTLQIVTILFENLRKTRVRVFALEKKYFMSYHIMTCKYVGIPKSARNIISGVVNPLGRHSQRK